MCVYTLKSVFKTEKKKKNPCQVTESAVVTVRCRGVLMISYTTLALAALDWLDH